MQKFISLFIVIFCLVSCSVRGERAVVNAGALSVAAGDEDWMSEDIITYQDGKIVNISGEGVDRFEKMNRVVFSFNKGLDTVCIKPISMLYDGVMPRVGKKCVKNFLNHISSPLYMLYGILSLQPRITGKYFCRFIVNTAFGTFGLNDPASRLEHLKFEKISGESVLKRYGGKPGHYLVLPVLGPASVRSLFGTLMDVGMDPINYIFSINTTTAFRSTQVIHERSALLKLSNDIQEVSLDEYAMVRNLYMQNIR